jgi:hypothetical protein
VTFCAIKLQEDQNNKEVTTADNTELIQSLKATIKKNNLTMEEDNITIKEFAENNKKLREYIENTG